MRPEKEMQVAAEAVSAIIRGDASPRLSELQLMDRIFQMSQIGKNYVYGFSAALDWALGEQWEIAETPGMIDAFIDFGR